MAKWDVMPDACNQEKVTYLSGHRELSSPWRHNIQPLGAVRNSFLNRPGQLEGLRTSRPEKFEDVLKTALVSVLGFELAASNSSAVLIVASRTTEQGLERTRN